MLHSKWKYPTNTITYNSWRAMRSRCLFDGNNSKNHKQKGIKICERWESYDLFYEDMGERPQNTTLDRIDNDGHYEPGNCRWATWQEQGNNTSKNVVIFNGDVGLTISLWCKKLGCSTRQRSKAYKRHQKYNARTFDELFTDKRLNVQRNEGRVNLCLECGTRTTCKWRRDGRQCNTCWHKHYRRSMHTKTLVNERLG